MPFRSVPNGRAFIYSQAAMTKEMLCVLRSGLIPYLTKGRIVPHWPCRGFERHALINSCSEATLRSAMDLP